MYGLDPLMVIFVSLYMGLTVLCFYVGFKKMWKRYKKNKRPNLKLIQGGKKDNRDG